MPRVTKIFQLHDELSDTWFDIYEVDGVDGRVVEVEIPRADRTTKVVRRALLSKGADDAVSDEDIRVAIEMDAPCVVRVARAGWREDESAFVSPLHASVRNPHVMHLLPPARNRFTANGLRSSTHQVVWPNQFFDHDLWAEPLRQDDGFAPGGFRVGPSAKERDVQLQRHRGG